MYQSLQLLSLQDQPEEQNIHVFMILDALNLIDPTIRRNIP